jgi:hypothetical protein
VSERSLNKIGISSADLISQVTDCSLKWQQHAVSSTAVSSLSWTGLEFVGDKFETSRVCLEEVAVVEFGLNRR